MCIPAQADRDDDDNGRGEDSKEPSAPTATGINEAILAAIWNEQSPLRGPMWDCQGRPVAVIYRGRWTAGNGPDFAGAMLSLGEEARLVTGCVEVHLRCADWWAHGHHTDPRYNDVVLHVVLWPTGARPVTRADGVSVPTLVLADYITLPTHQLLARMQPLFTNLGSLSEEPCWRRTEHWPVERLLEHIDTAGDARLHARAARMEAGIVMHGSPDAVFYEGLMDALGYSANRQPMRAVAAALPLDRLLTPPLDRDEQERAALLESVLLGAGGLLPSQRRDVGPLDWVSARYAEEVERMWNSYAPAVGLPPDHPPPLNWKTARVRPANWPARRLAAAARLLAKLLWAEGGMLAPFIEQAYACPSAPRQLARRWTHLLMVRGEDDCYWLTHADFGRPLSTTNSVGGGKGRGRGRGESGAEDTALVGRSRAADIVVNVLLPALLAHAEHSDMPDLRNAVLGVYACYPKLAENQVTRAMADEALGPHRRQAINTARRQQGLIHLYRLYCEARRCYECPISGIRLRVRN